MRKQIALLCSVLALLAAGGCHQEELPPVPKLSANCACVVRYKDVSYNCRIGFLSKDVETITIQTPAALSGLTFSKGQGQYKLSYGSLVCRSDSALMPQQSLPQKITNAVHDFRRQPQSLQAEKTGTGYTFTSPAYALVTDAEGLIREIHLQ